MKSIVLFVVCVIGIDLGALGDLAGLGGLDGLKGLGDVAGLGDLGNFSDIIDSYLSLFKDSKFYSGVYKGMSGNKVSSLCLKDISDFVASEKLFADFSIFDITNGDKMK